MPLPAAILVTIVSIGSIAMVAFQVRDLLRRKRNLKHYERGEPLEKTGEWD